uniref:MAK10-like protein n=1 Tax=Tanacetum cinerariifolium TaxID=118510 RepID=A0A6L2J412_TANCI|nr:hypothetical protein [Tanacetum cinerariifolium]
MLISPIHFNQYYQSTFQGGKHFPDKPATNRDGDQNTTIKRTKPTLEDDFQDLHLNLSVLEVLAHAPIYNSILDKYVDSLELGKNGSSFVQGEVPTKMEDPGLFTLLDFIDCHLPREWEIARDVELNPFKDTLVFKRMDKAPKNGDGAWHAKIRLIDPDEEEFTKTLQLIPTTRKLSERESPREIINLDHFYDT